VVGSSGSPLASKKDDILEVLSGCFFEAVFAEC
jgi:hypothetical protein